MLNRRTLRSIVLQALFELEFTNSPKDELEKILLRADKEQGEEISKNPFVTKLANGIIDKQKELDEIIEKAAPDWPVDKISSVDRNVLRLGLYELLFSNREEVPPKVAINEAIELAKNFGSDNSSKFVNGVIGAVYREIGEPGKAQTSTKSKFKDVPFEEMPIKKMVGAVVYAMDGENIYFALVHDVFGYWTLSKGKLEKDEDERRGVIRKTKEEIGLDVEVLEELGRNEYIAADPEEGKIRKRVAYFLVKSNFDELDLKETGGLDDAKWFKITDVIDLRFYDDILTIITKAINILVSKK
jgi:N utilization substance protein B